MTADTKPPTPMPQVNPGLIEDCALHLAAHLGRPITRATLRGLLPDPSVSGSDGRSSAVRAVIAAADRAGLRAAFGRCAFDAIDPILLPAIVFPLRGDPFVLHSRRDDSFAVHDPKLGPGLIEQGKDAFPDGLTDGDVHVLSFKLDYTETADAVAGATHGHWFRSALRANRWAYIQVGLAAVMVNVLALVISLFSMVVYDRVLPSGATESLFALAIGVGIALCFDFIARTLRAGFTDHAGQKADLQVGERIFDHLMDMEMREQRWPVGQVAASMREMESLRDFFTSATMTAVVDLPFAILFLAVIWLLAGSLVIIPAVAVVMVLLIGFAVQPALSRISDRIMAEGQNKQTVLVETLTGMETIKAIGAARNMRARWGAALRQQSAYAVRSRAMTQGAINATSLVQQAAQVMIIVYGALLVVSGQITPGVLIGAVILTGRALAPLGLIAQTLTRVHQTRSAYRSLDALMQSVGEHPAGKPWLSRPQIKGGLRFDTVSFSYPRQNGRALDGVSFTIAPGERVAMIGSVGSGKSTIARLMLGLYTPEEGVVQLDGVDIRQIDPADLRSHFGVVLQESWLISGSLRENIALGAWRASDAAILQAGRLSGVESFAARHPDGYNMMLGEGGKGLSGGQRQMVSLARALVSDPQVLILDEPTAALDNDSEAALIEGLKKVLPGRTLIVMTHRKSLLQLVDRVIVLDAGKISADGLRSAVVGDGQISVGVRR